MSLLRKVIWSVRAVCLRPFFGRLDLPSCIGPTTFLLGARRMKIGRRVRIFPGFRGEVYPGGVLTIEDNVAIEQNVHVTVMGDLRIGSGTAVLGFVSITDIEHEYRDPGVPIIDQGTRHMKTEIGSSCFIGMGARIQAGTILGDGCIVGSNAVVRGTYPAHSVLVGVPARVIKYYDKDRQEWVEADR